jgi:hypothetical protein
MIDEGDISSIQRNISIGRPKSMRQADGYVPALTSRSNSYEISLQLSENITFIAVCRIYISAISKET